ncbi:hypothetical protein QLQ12_43415 [Actinoplanes sp. NEAU-A12]|uniref:WD40 repeat protein n=1 Tax=Actinoplanes sandaracinus TaxID=3045177 RepID=A0ABT6X0L3_9ACTN|nr:hypothetical protein [Actinoplanes sandaracinus]MDI6105454.1 hypothetical protein [Actinoplanes sandaracinus]
MTTTRPLVSATILAMAGVLTVPATPAAARTPAEPRGHIRYLSGIGVSDFSDLYDIRPDRGHRRLLLTDLDDRLPGNAAVSPYGARPGYSPDLRTVVYQGDDGGVWKARPDGAGNPQRILPPLDTGVDPYCVVSCRLTNPVFSPDGTQVASLEAGLSGELARLIVFDADGSHVRAFPVSEHGQAMKLQGSFSWTADGTTVAYAMGPEDSQRSALHVTDTRTGATTQLTDGRSWRIDADISPDGRFVAYSSTEPVGYDYHADRDLFIIRVDTRAVRQLTDTDSLWESSPVWSPRGDWIAYSRQPADMTTPVKPSVRRISADGSVDRPLDVNGRVYAWVR